MMVSRRLKRRMRIRTCPSRMRVCPDCHGTGTNPEAKQAWDIPEAPEPDCQTCQGEGQIPDERDEPQPDTIEERDGDR